MKLVSFLKNGNECVGLFSGEKVYDVYVLHADLPNSMNEILMRWDECYPILIKLSKEIENSSKVKSRGLALKEVHFLAPVPHPTSLRDGYAFRQHVETARRNRGLEMTALFDSFPVFYFGNHHTVKGPGPVHCIPDHFKKLDFELEAAVVISKKGKNISAEDADSFIAGMMIMNDFSARVLQIDEMLLNLGPVNGKTVSEGNLSDMNWTFAEIIARASYGVELYPGDIIGSGTVGTGCFMELNGTGKLNDPNYPEQWLTAGDKVELAINGLGVLTNQILVEPSNYSILQLKK